ncbi:hypothetical protein HMPREF0063_10744 [Aeromicrobium marinum DSM 15272]|uniref:WYL domain-containing protein n=1 Tax=Aeromicrobium marinum DSM 15272 TaxID=585531 RepID=E2S9V4_9ACTN|nr:WYL domain-containing protein [Aeromicrobium marinum]EFQ84028.1 hypothetical protein HMPREF0063_10744 [Aeromicrobium marinum DSM 15272]
MSASGRQVQRMLALVPYLQANDGIPVTRVAAEFGVKPQVIRADLRQLMFTGVGEFAGELIDVDLSALDEDGVIFLRDAEFMTRPLRVNAREAAALIVALRTLRATADTEGARVIDSALSKLEHAVGTTVEAPVDVVLEPVDPQVRSTISAALAEGRRIRLVYATVSRDEQTVREIEPRRLFTEDGRAYLEAWCLLAGDIRFFRLDRMVDVSLLDAPVEHHRPVPTDLPERMFVVGEQTPSAVLDLAPAARWLVDHYDAQVLDDQDETWRVRLYGGDTDWLCRLVLRNAGAVTVVEPADLADLVGHRAGAALAAYDGPEPTT